MSFAAFGFKMLDKLGSNLSDTYGTGNTLRRQQREEAQGDFLERERLGIQARVEGAKAAGLHPLVAMGYQSGNSPSTIIGGSDSGSQYVVPEKTSREPQDPNLAKYNAANARLAEARANQAELDYENALVASRKTLSGQPGNPPAVSLPTEPENRTPALTARGVKVVPNQIVSSINGTESGVQPTGANLRGTDGLLYKGLSDNALKQTEDMELLRLGLFAYLNRNNILDKIGFNDARMTYRMWLQKMDQARRQKSEDTREMTRLINQSRARR